MRFLSFVLSATVVCGAATFVAADVVNLSEITSESAISTYGNVTAGGRDSVGSFFKAPDVGYNTVAVVLAGSELGPVSDGEFLRLDQDDVISFDAFTGTDVPAENTGGAIIVRLFTGVWDGTNYSYSGDTHVHVFGPLVPNGQWETLSQRVDSFIDPIAGGGQLDVIAYTIDAVQWEPVTTPYTFGIGSVAAVPEPSAAGFAGIAFVWTLLRRRKHC